MSELDSANTTVLMTTFGTAAVIARQSVEVFVQLERDVVLQQSWSSESQEISSWLEIVQVNIFYRHLGGTH